MGKDTFFFEEDPAAGDASGVTGKEHAEAFFTVLEEEGIIKDRLGVESFDQMKTASELHTKTVQSSYVEIEYGVVKQDYVIHITPTHPVRNLSKKAIYDQALKAAVVMLNKVVPPVLRVDIYLPQTDWQIKATSFVIRDASEAWNFDQAAVEALIPELLEQTTKLCVQS